MRTYNRCRGAARFPINIVHGKRRYVYLKINLGFDAAYREADVNSAIQQALGAETSSGESSDTGLFSLARRQFGESVHDSHIVAAVQQVDGVVWVKLKSVRLNPGYGRVHRQLRVTATRILALRSDDLKLSLLKHDTAGECSS